MTGIAGLPLSAMLSSNGGQFELGPADSVQHLRHCRLLVAGVVEFAAHESALWFSLPRARSTVSVCREVFWGVSTSPGGRSCCRSGKEVTGSGLRPRYAVGATAATAV